MASGSPLSAVPLISILSQGFLQLDICSMKVHCKKSGRVLCGLCSIAEAVPNLCQIDAAPLDVDGDLVFFRQPQFLADLALLFVLDVVQAQAVSLFLLDLLAVIQYARRVASMRSRHRSVSICCRRRCSSVMSVAASPTLSPTPPPSGIPFRLWVVFSATSRMC